MASAKPDVNRTDRAASNIDRPVEKRSNGDGRTLGNDRKPGQLGQYIQKHPVASVAIAVGIGALLQASVATLARAPAKSGKPRKSRSKPQSLSTEPDAMRQRTHDFGAADMKFTTHHPDGKNVEFNFAWKKRPTDAPETDWPEDKMGFTAARPDGKQTAFTFTGKTRPIPDEKSAVGDNRPGLGSAKMEFRSSAPGRKDFAFTWSRTPPGLPAEASNQPTPASGSRKGRSIAKTSKKKSSRKKSSKKTPAR